MNPITPHPPLTTTLAVLGLCAVGAYLLGSISFSFLIVRWRTGKDLRDLGTSNLGARNAGRALGWPYFTAVFAGDVGKAVVSVLVARYAGASLGAAVQAMMVATLAVLLGHNYSIFLGFTGGKGLASAVGALAVLSPAMLLAEALLALAFLILTRSIYAAPALAAAAFPFVAYWLSGGSWLYAVFGLFVGGLVFLRHIANLRAWLAGLTRCR